MSGFEALIIALFILTWVWIWICCKKAQQAYWAAERLFRWVNIAHGPVVCTVDLHPECKGAGEDWPPPEVGGFPPPDGGGG